MESYPLNQHQLLIVIYNDVSESGWRPHDGITGIGYGDLIMKYITI